MAGDYGYGEDVPGIGGDYVGGDEVGLGAGLGDSVGVEVAFVGVSALEKGCISPARGGSVRGFRRRGHRGVVAPGLGDAQAEFGGAGHETELRPRAARRAPRALAWGMGQLGLGMEFGPAFADFGQ